MNVDRPRCNSPHRAHFVVFGGDNFMEILKRVAFSGMSLAFSTEHVVAHSPHCGYEINSKDAYTLWYSPNDFDEILDTKNFLCKRSHIESDCVITTCREGAARFIVTKGLPGYGYGMTGFSKDYEKKRKIEQKLLRARGG